MTDQETQQDSFANLTVRKTARIPEITPEGVKYRYRGWYEEPETDDTTE